MRLLVDTANVESPGGKQLLSELVRALAERREPGSTIVVVRADTSGPLAGSEGVESIDVRRASGWRTLWRHLSVELPAIAEARRADVVYALSGLTSRRLIRGRATVTSINNMLPFTPEQIRYFPLFSRARLRLVLLRRAMIRSCKDADSIVFPSRFGLETVARWAGPIEPKSFIATNPIPDDVRIDPARAPSHPYDGRPFFFYLSVIYWYKNHLNLIEGYRRALAADPDLPDLLLAGPSEDRAYTARIERAIESPDLGGRVRYLGKIDRGAIPGFLHHATANVFPSLCETSSFVQGEILGAGGVMACSNLGPMPEVAGDAALTFDPHDPDDISRALRALARDPDLGRRLRRSARDRAREFTWEACGDAVWSAARFALASRSASAAP